MNRSCSLQYQVEFHLLDTGPVVTKEVMENIVQKVTDQLNHTDERIHTNAFDYLAISLQLKLLPEAIAIPLIEVVKSKLKDPDTDVRSQALYCLLSHAPSIDKKAMANLLEMVKDYLNDPDKIVRKDACNLVTYLVINLDNDIPVEITFSSETSAEAGFTQIFYDWIKAINSVPKLPEKGFPENLAQVEQPTC